MRTITVKLPNGVLIGNEVVRDVTIRKLGGEEEDLLLDKEERKKGDALYKVLKNCTVAVGTIEDRARINAIYDNDFLLADMTYMLVELRSWGISPNYSFEHQCERCEAISNHRIDLNTLTVNEQRPEYRGKTRVDIELEDAPRPLDPSSGDLLPQKDWSYGKVPLTIRPLFMRDSKTLESIRADYPKHRATRELLLSIVSYDGHPDLPWKALQQMDSGARSAIRDALDKINGGLDIELILTCRKCQRSYKDNMVVNTQHFFFRKGDLPLTQTALPHLEGGSTLTSWRSGLAGLPPKSDSSASKNESST